MGDLLNKANHKVVLDQRKSVVLTGVNDVCSFHENEIILKTEAGTMIIAGENLHVGKLLLEEGRVDVEGRIDALSYETLQTGRKRWLFGPRS